MRREIVAFDEEVIRKELAALPSKDRARLVAVIEHYLLAGTGDPYPARIDSYDEDVARLRHASSAHQGRLLFFVAESRKDFQLIVMLVVYKKEGAAVPASVLRAARARLRFYKSQG